MLTDADGALRSRCIKNGDGVTPLIPVTVGTRPVLRCLIAAGMEHGRAVCLAGLHNKQAAYNESELRQAETFINGAWLVLRRLRHTRALRLAKDRAEAGTKAKSEFLSYINHELRTPLTAILSYAETLLTLGPDDEHLRKRGLEAILRQAGHMHRLVGDLLSLCRLENLDLPLDMRTLSLRALAENAVDGMKRQLEDKGLRVSLAIPPDLRVRADGHFLAQVFRNLLENAGRYAHRDTAININAVSNRDTVTVSVNDQGTRIDADDLPKIFEHFYRGKRDNAAHQSTGIGLSICRHVVKRHGGRIWAENTPSGVSMCFSLARGGA
jgi:signal transduction histidine kinase